MSILSERFNRALSRAKAGHEFKDMAEAQAFMNQFVGVKVDDLVASQNLSVEDKAQELAFDAMESSDFDEAHRLFQEAVALDSACCDGLCGLAAMDSNNFKELKDRLEAIVANEKVRLGPGVFKEQKGRFWGIVETRPYMRALFQLAETLNAGGYLLEAKKHYAAMIQLNRRDNQGVRQIYGPLCLRLGDLKAFLIFRKKFKHSDDPELLWSDVLAAFLAGDEAGAADAVRKARESNGFVQAYLLGHRNLPRQLPEMYSLGSREQAIIAARYLLPPWQAHPASLAWLAKQR